MEGVAQFGAKCVILEAATCNSHRALGPASRRSCSAPPLLMSQGMPSFPAAVATAVATPAAGVSAVVLSGPLHCTPFFPFSFSVQRVTARSLFFNCALVTIFVSLSTLAFAAANFACKSSFVTFWLPAPGLVVVHVVGPQDADSVGILGSCVGARGDPHALGDWALDVAMLFAPVDVVVRGPAAEEPCSPASSQGGVHPEGFLGHAIDRCDSLHHSHL